MNSLHLNRLVKVVPFALALFSFAMMAHGVHGIFNGDPGGSGGPNLHLISAGDPGGSGGPNHLHMVFSGDPGGSGGPN